ncbi:uncharacterized protein V6R79_019142 [Siganus canaliculatus]
MIKLLSVAIVAGLFCASNQQNATFPSAPPLEQEGDLAPRPSPALPCDYPTHLQCWTEWFDRDDPYKRGDYEILLLLRQENPGKICPSPAGIEAQTLDGHSVAEAGDVIYTNNPQEGFICRNADQFDNLCEDYRVRFSCHPPFCGGGVCWTDWYDQDDPSGTGDWETLPDLRREYPGEICEYPLLIEVVTTDTMTPAVNTGQIFSVHNPTGGFVCRNSDQKGRRCLDYKVRFGCPCEHSAVTLRPPLRREANFGNA